MICNENERRYGEGRDLAAVREQRLRGLRDSLARGGVVRVREDQHDDRALLLLGGSLSFLFDLFVAPSRRAFLRLIRRRGDFVDDEKIWHRLGHGRVHVVVRVHVHVIVRAHPAQDVVVDEVTVRELRSGGGENAKRRVRDRRGRSRQVGQLLAADELRVVPYERTSGWSSKACQLELKGAEGGD